MSDSYSRPQTRESVESAKKWLEYESFEYESRLDTALGRADEGRQGKDQGEKGEYEEERGARRAKG